MGLTKNHTVICLTHPVDLCDGSKWAGRARSVTGTHPLARYLSPQTIGGKAYSLYRMASMGFLVPAAFAIPVWVYHAWKAGEVHWETALRPLWKGMDGQWNVGNGLSSSFCVAIRSGAPVSMPGMMDTILQVPLADRIAIIHHIEEVFRSFESDRCQAYRKSKGIGDIGTACIVQAMVLPTHQSGAGVVHSIDPVSGKGWGLYGEYLEKMTGDKLVGGTTNANPISGLMKSHPYIHDELLLGVTTLENAWGGPVEVEFAWGMTLPTQPRPFLYWLQCRLARLSKDVIPVIKGKLGRLLGRGHVASQGLCKAKVVTPESVSGRGQSQNKIWVAPTTTPDDYPYMEKAKGIVTYTGGTTCHAAVVARELGKPCIVAYDGEALLPGMRVTVDAYKGEVYGV